jgi:hypothetical protein
MLLENRNNTQILLIINVDIFDHQFFDILTILVGNY